MSGCITHLPKQSSLKALMIDECADERRSGTGFNSRKSYELVREECGQIMARNERFRKIDDRHFKKSQNTTSYSEQEDFDAETWFLITEVMRKKYYPDFLEPEQEVVRAKVLWEQQEKTIEDKSIWREWAPRLLPVSPYWMRYNQIGMANEAIDDLIYQEKSDNMVSKLRVIRTILTKEGQKKDPYRRHY